jgi:ATP phosphoribosyltransferase
VLTFAVPKGRMLQKTLGYLRETGVDIPDFDPESRELIVYDRDKKFKFVIVKPFDVTTYVEYGAADVGVAGKDVIEEHDADIYEPLDLGFSECRLVVARPEDYNPDSNYPRVATEFMNIAEKHFAQKGENVELIKMHGSVELTPLIDLSQRIVDIVSTGRTLRQNGLVEEETILHSSARLIVNRPSLKLHRDEVEELIDGFSTVAEDAAPV